jgi:hypothetical protein
MIYHYTKGHWLVPILADGLLPSCQNEDLVRGEKPALWFTTNEQWENTVLLRDAPTLREAHNKATRLGGLARIVCDESVAPIRWKEAVHLLSIPSKIANLLYRSAIEVGSRPGEWRVTVETVPVSSFLAVQIYDGREWIDIWDGKTAQIPTTAVEAYRQTGREPTTCFKGEYRDAAAAAATAYSFRWNWRSVRGPA